FLPAGSCSRLMSLLTAITKPCGVAIRQPAASSRSGLPISCVPWAGADDATRTAHRAAARRCSAIRAPEQCVDLAKRLAVSKAGELQVEPFAHQRAFVRLHLVAAFLGDDH